jgi:hypothetical protein
MVRYVNKIYTTPHTTVLSAILKGKVYPITGLMALKGR